MLVVRFLLKRNKTKEKKPKPKPSNQTSKNLEPIPCFLRYVCEADVGDSFCTSCFTSLSAVAGLIPKVFDAKYYHQMPWSHYSSFCLAIPFFPSPRYLPHILKEQVIPTPRRLLSLRSCWCFPFLLEMCGVPALAALQKSMFAPHWALGWMPMIKCDSPVL